MAKITRKQRDFIRSNQGLNVKELSDKTGLAAGEIQKAVNEIKLRAATAQEPAQSVEFRLCDSAVWVSALAILALTVLVYIPTLGYEFVNWDDAWAVTENSSIHALGWDSLKWMFTALNKGWNPLTWLSHAAVYHFWESSPSAHHMANVLIHGANAALVFMLSLRILSLGSSVLTGINGSQSHILITAAITALLFALHPTHVESVAWVAERKDVLYGFFFLLSMMAYLNYQAEGEKSPAKYALCLVCFMCSLMSKPMAITLPVVLLILDFWPLNRAGKGLVLLIAEKIPFFILSIITAILAQKAQMTAENELQVQTIKMSAFSIMNAFNSLIFYMSKTILPIGLLPFYPIESAQGKAFSPEYMVSLLMVLALTYACHHYGGKRRPYLWAAWLFYVVSSGPILGVTQVGSTAAADRYTYLPTLSLMLLLAGAGTNLYAKAAQDLRPILAAGAFLLMTGLGYASSKQMALWKNSMTLWESVVMRFPDISSIAYGNLGDAYSTAGKTEEGIQNFRRAIAINPGWPNQHYGLGRLLMKKGSYQEAIQEFQKTVEINPKYPGAHASLGLAWFRDGKYDESIAAYRQALAGELKEPHIIHDQFANALLLKGLYQEAIQEYKTATEINPQYANAHGNLGTAYMKAGKLDEALDSFRRAVAIDPGVSRIIHDQYGNALLSKGLPKEALKEFLKAVELDPQYVNAWQNLWVTYESLEMNDEALASAQKSIEAVPGFADGHRNLGISYAKKKLFKESESAFQKALALIPGNPEYMMQLADAYHLQGKTGQAIELCQDALKLNPDRADVLITLSSFYIDQNRNKAALDILRKAIALSPNDPVAYNNLGVAHEKSGQKDLAIQNYELAVKINPQFNPAHANLARLYAAANNPGPVKNTQ